MNETLQTLVAGVEPFEVAGSCALYNAPPVKYLIEGLIPLNSVVGLTGVPGTGKAQPLSARVLTPRGWTTMGELCVGDSVIGGDGKSHTVIGVYDRGELPVYRVVTSDGCATLACAEHLWLTQTRNERHRNLPGQVRTTAQLRESLLRPGNDGGTNHSIPTVAPVEFAPVDPPPIDPYFLGLFLADGCRRYGNFSISNPEPDLVATIERVVTEMGGTIRHHGIDRHIACVPLRTAIEQLGLAQKKSAEKFIPPQYLYGTATTRRELLAGYLDGDGQVVDGTHFVGATSSPALANDLVDLVMSLGGRASTYVHKNRGYKKDGVFRPCLDSTEIRLYFPDGHNPSHSKKHSTKWRGSPRVHVRYIKDIQDAGAASCRCIAIDSPDHLYVTDGWIVTHNTWFSLEAMRAVSTGTSFLDKFPSRQAPVLFVGNDSSFLDYARQWTRLTQEAYTDYEDDIESKNIHTNPLDTNVHFLIQSDFVFDDLGSIARLIRTSLGVMRPPREAMNEETWEKEVIEEEHYGLIVFDCLSRLTAAQENNNTEMSRVFNHIRQVAEATGASVLLLHHNASPGEHRTGEEWRGAGASGAGIAGLDAHFHLVKQGMGSVQLKVKKFRGLTPPPFTFLLDVNDNEKIAELTYIDESKSVEEVESEVIEDMLQVLRDRNNEPTTIKEFAAALKAKYLQFTTDTEMYNFIANRMKVIRQMPDARILRVGKVGKAHTYKLSPKEEPHVSS